MFIAVYFLLQFVCHINSGSTYDSLLNYATLCTYVLLNYDLIHSIIIMYVHAGYWMV